jgi:hypothetical protein
MSYWIGERETNLNDDSVSIIFIVIIMIDITPPLHKNIRVLVDLDSIVKTRASHICLSFIGPLIPCP